MFDHILAGPDQGEWYVIRVVSGTEQAVEQAIMQRRETFALENFILETFVPMHDSVSVSSTGKKIRRKKNIFPGYILVRMVVTNESWYIVRNTPNVTGFLGAGTVPVSVRGEELKRLMGIVQEQSEEYRISLRPDDMVMIHKGPFEGSEGRVTEVNEAKGLIKVVINLLGRDTPVEIDFGSVSAKK